MRNVSRPQTRGLHAKRRAFRQHGVPDLLDGAPSPTISKPSPRRCNRCTKHALLERKPPISFFFRSVTHTTRLAEDGSARDTIVDEVFHARTLDGHGGMVIARRR